MKYKQNKYIELPEENIVAVFFENDNNAYFIADINDIPLIEKYTWTMDKNKKGRYRARAWVDDKFVSFERLKLGVMNPDIEIDHQNHCWFDNRTSNLQLATKLQNMMNRPNGIGTISRSGDSWLLTIPTDTGEKNVLVYDSEDAAKEGKEKWLSENGGNFYYPRAQELAKQNWTPYIDDEIRLLIINGKYEQLLEEVKALPERSIFKILLRRFYCFKKRIPKDDDAKSDVELIDIEMMEINALELIKKTLDYYDEYKKELEYDEKM